MIRAVLGITALLLGFQVTASNASETLAMKHYGQGVYDYYGRLYHEAIEHFDTAITYDNRDPRIYLFRGLAKQRIGDSEGAKADFLMGSQLEAALNRRDVGRALQRIQGADRLTIEQYRRDARSLPRETLAKIIPPRPNEVLRGPVQRRPVRSQPAPDVARNLPADDSDPFGDDAAGLLGRGDLTASAAVTSSDRVGRAAASDTNVATDEAGMFDDSEPFGSGVVDSFAPADAEAEADDFVFGDEPAEEPLDPMSNQEGEPSRGVLGAAFRAITRGITPNIPGAQQGQQFVEGFNQGQEMGQAIAEDPGFGQDANQDAGAGDQGDPFADDFVDPFNQDNADSSDQDNMPADDGATSDDFVDPFDF